MIETLKLVWSEPKTVNTKRGPRALRTASPTPAFWGKWKTCKSDLQAAGISVSKFNGQWEVSCWSALEQEPQTEVAHSGEVVQAVIDSTVNWSDEQLNIFTFFRIGTGNAVIGARAGTGKSTTIKQGFTVAPESEMLYAVFNKKNQKEALEKITDPRVDVRTLHSLGFLYISAVWRGVKPDDGVEADRIIAAGCDAEEPASAIERLVGFAKNVFISLPTVEQLVDLANDKGIFSGQEAPEAGGWTVEKLAATARRAMEIATGRDGQSRISFNDMVWLPVAMRWVAPRYDLVCVDEAQDMNLPQLEMACKAVRPGGRVIVVGDDRQAIYGFRGAAQDGMNLMRERLQAHVLGLTTTYRCPKSVVALANEIVSDYVAAPSAPEGIVDEIEMAALVEQAKVGDAILSRLNAPLMSACLALLRKGVSARIEGRDIGRQLVGMVRKLKARSVPDFLRRLVAWGDKQKARMVGKTRDAKCALIDDQVATLSAVAEGAESVSDIEAKIYSLFQDSDTNVKPAVVLSSVHKAKGLEWNRVFVLTGTFKKNGSDEEKNIWYVAVTRAKQQLTLVG